MTGPAAVDGISAETRDGVLRLELARPDRKNSLDPPAIRRLIASLEDAATDDALRAVLLTGIGSDFCSGADWVATNTASDRRPRTGSIQRRTTLQAHRLVELLMEIQLPVVCAVHGWAAGLGCQIALAADFTVAAESSRFWLPFTKRGFSPDSGATWLIPRLIGLARAKQMLMLGRVVTGAEAAVWGMIHQAVPDEKVDTAVEALVAEVAASASVAVGLTKRCLHRSLATGMSEAMEAEAMALELSSRSADFKEGLRAFKERRDAEFEGR